MKPLQQSIETPGPCPENESVQAHYARMKRKTLNYRPVIGSLLKTLQEHDFALVSVDNGDGKEKLTGTPREQRQQAKALIAATDESSLYMTHPTQSWELWIFIVLGNEPEETVCDYTIFEPLETAIGAFSAKWIGKPCPTK